MDAQYNYRDYYTTDKYKGFYKCEAPKNGFSRITRIAFTNGKEKIFATGIYPEDATAKAFIAIDKYHEQNKLRTEQLANKQVLSKALISLN